MDISFDIYNDKGDHLRVALSYYDMESVGVFTSDPLTLSLTFYDVTLIRMAGSDYVGYKMLYAVSDTLAKFMDENDGSVLCFYCDDQTDIERHNRSILPQEYRSRLFSRLFDQYIRRNPVKTLINHCIGIEIDGRPRFAHFICEESYRDAVSALGEILMDK